jgi:hypothetical protein
MNIQLSSKDVLKRCGDGSIAQLVNSWSRLPFQHSVFCLAPNYLLARSRLPEKSSTVYRTCLSISTSIPMP